MFKKIHNIKIIILTVVLFFSLIIFTSCTGNKDSLADGILTVGLNDQFLPFEYRDEQENLEGFDIDLAEALANKLGVELEIKTIDWEEIFNGLNQGEYEAIVSGVSKTSDRQKDYSLSEPYINNGLVIVTTVNNPNPATEYEQIDGKTVGVQEGTSADTAAEVLHDTAGKNVTVKKYQDSTELFKALESGEIDYILGDVGVAAYFINNQPNVFKVSSNDVLTNEPLVIAAASNNKALTEKINQALSELRTDGTLKALSEKWFGGDWTTDIDTEIREIQ